MILTCFYFAVLVIKLQPHVGQYGQATGSQSVSVRLSFRFTVSLVLSTFVLFACPKVSNLCIELGSTLLPLSAVVCLVRVSVFVVLGHALSTLIRLCPNLHLHVRRLDAQLCACKKWLGL